MANDYEGLNFDAQIQLWGKFAARKLIKSLKHQGIKDSGGLERSIQNQITKAGGDMTVAMFKFFRYGRFVDMGTGRGIAIGAEGTVAFAKYRYSSKDLAHPRGQLMKAVKRRPKPWYSRTMYREIKILSEKLLADMDHQVIDAIQARIRRINSHSSNASK